MYGGGTFTSQNKVLPGAYINVISMARATASMGKRGIATMPMELNWGPSGVFEVTPELLQKSSRKIFGYAYTADELKGVRDLLLGAKKAYLWRLNESGVKASNEFAEAVYAGTRGNDLKVVIQENVDSESRWDVSLYLGTVLVDLQTGVSAASELVDNEFVVWKDSAVLKKDAGTALTGGTNSLVSGESHQAYLDAIEPYVFNSMGVVITDDVTKSLYVAFEKRMREKVGAKFALVLHNKAADYEGVINVKNKVTDKGWSEASLVYWVTGVQASLEINESCMNKKYDGEFTIDAAYTQAQLEAAIEAGEFTFHKVGEEIKVLNDINSLVTTTETKGDVFKDNQTMRLADQAATDTANVFNTKYHGKVPNDASGRISLWNDLNKLYKEYLRLRAIQNYTDEDLNVSEGDVKMAVVSSVLLNAVNVMGQLYMNISVV